MIFHMIVIVTFILGSISYYVAVLQLLVNCFIMFHSWNAIDWFFILEYIVDVEIGSHLYLFLLPVVII